MKMKKDELVEAVSEFFGLEINWSKLSRDELKELYEFLNKPDNVIGRLIDIMGIDGFVKTANNVILHKIVDEKPVRKLLKEWLLGGGQVE